MDDVRGDFLGPPHGTTPAAVIAETILVKLKPSPSNPVRVMYSDILLTVLEDDRMRLDAAYRKSHSRGHFDATIRHLMKLKEECQEKYIPEFVTDGIEKAMKLLEARETYCIEISTPPSEALTQLAADTLSHPWEQVYAEGKSKWKLGPDMVAGPLEGQFLQTLVSISKAKRVLEVGMFTGYSALACAEVLPEDGEVVTCEFDPYLENVARNFFNRSPHGKKIDIRKGPAKDTLTHLANEKQSFDVVFIDANKDGYLEYYQIIMDNDLLNKDGFIVFDNALRGGYPYIPGTTAESEPSGGWAIMKCNEFVSTDPRVRCVMVPMRDGVFVVRRKEALEETR